MYLCNWENTNNSVQAQNPLHIYFILVHTYIYMYEYLICNLENFEVVLFCRTSYLHFSTHIVFSHQITKKFFQKFKSKNIFTWNLINLKKFN